MRRRIRVRVVHRADRNKYCLRWRDRAGKTHEEVTEAVRRRDAQTLAGHKESQIAAEGSAEAIPWHIVRDRYEAEALQTKRTKTKALWTSSTNSLFAFEEPDYVQDLTADYFSRYSAALLAKGRSVATLAAYLRALRAALNWAGEIYPTYTPPRIRVPKAAQKMKGRPITLEEFERMLAATEKIVGRKRGKTWRAFLRALWASGLRLGEAMTLSWDQPDQIHIVDLDGRRPMLGIPGDRDKGKRSRLLAMAPEFAKLLRHMPSERRHGPVFRLTLESRVVDLIVASETISAIGEAAKVRVRSRIKRQKDGTQKQVVKWASAHDLRRSFGTRWAGRGLAPTKLRELMRHSDIATTMQYYVEHDASAVADELWRASGDQSGDRPRPKKRRAGERKH